MYDFKENGGPQRTLPSFKDLQVYLKIEEVTLGVKVEINRKEGSVFIAIAEPVTIKPENTRSKTTKRH